MIFSKPTFIGFGKTFLHPFGHGADDEDSLLQGLNSFRQSQNLPALTKNRNAECLADEIADQLEDQPCTTITSTSNIVPTTPSQISNYPKLLNKCIIDANTTTDGAILPVCVHKLVPTLVLTNYTRSQYAKQLNNSKYTGVGVGSEDDWTVVILTTSAQAGSFASAAGSFSQAALFHYLVPLLLGLSLILLS